MNNTYKSILEILIVCPRFAGFLAGDGRVLSYVSEFDSSVMEFHDMFIDFSRENVTIRVALSL